MAYWDGTRWLDDMSAATTPPSRRRRLLGAGAEAALITTLIFGLIAGTTFAAKGGNSNNAGGGKGKPSGGTIALVVLDGADAVPNHGERVAFDVATSATDRPFVGVRCWQNSSFIYDAYTGYFDDYMFDPWVTLDSLSWQDAMEASCTARLFYYDKRGRQKVLATTDFVAQP